MASSENQLQELLQVAEAKFADLAQENIVLQEEITALKLENENLSQSFFELMDAQRMEAEQMVQLTEQIWSLEEALALSREKALEQMEIVKSKFNSMNDYMKDTLEAATQNASRMELAARVYELSQISNISDIDEQLADYNENLKPGKL
jgi:hypothetical protein